MTVQRARSIDDLYAEVADYDLVLTTDAPLSLALNRRIDRPHLGRFAATPRMLASGEFRPRDDRSLFLELIRETDLSWKHAAYLLENILGCWEETGELHAILEYEQFDTPAAREALAVIEETDSAHRDLAAHTVDDGTDVAVVGEDQFTALDKQVLPQDYDTVSPFTDGAFDLPDFHMFDSTTAIVETLVDNVSAETADDVAVIMDRGGEYPALVESAFEATEIPFYGGPGFADDDNVRTFLRLLRTAHAASGVRVADVRPILSRLGMPLHVTHDEKRLAELDHPDVAPVQQFCETVGEQTFGEALATFEEWCDASLDAFREELSRLGICDERVSAASLDDLGFYLDSFDVPVDRDDAGVLLADATAAAYVDRPVVFYLGMDVDWTHHVLDRPWIDAEAKDRQYLRQFQLLLQNGVDQYFLVQETSAGSEVTPCLYFHDLLDEEFDTFGDLPHVPHTRQVRYDDPGFEKGTVDADPTTIETVSQSSLSTFVNCPRDYFFDRIVDNPNRDYFRKGNLYHDFAEFCVNHPDVIETADRETLVDVLLEEMKPYVDDVELETLATEFEVGIEIIRDFLEENPPTEQTYDGYDRQEPDNFFADHFDRPIESSVTERWFENPDLGGKGKVDLIHAPTRLLDYKSGSRKSASKVVSQSDIEEISDEPNFQALLYLTHHRRVQPDERLEFVFFHFLDLLDDAVTGDPDVEDALVRVNYHPVPFAEYAGRREAFDALTEGVAESNNRRKTLERMGHDAYATFFERHEFPDTTDSDEVLDSEFATRFTDRAIGEVGDHKYVDRGTDSALKKLCRIRSRNYFVDDVDAFETFLDDQLDRINECHRSRFPVGDPNFDRVTHRDLIRHD
ncbi:PD-(D/E)XK nuclease family protein [Halostella salina]|uniref:PD-(D/E)XK nuclease family protein n=1 Tax=Halostella salina TaxID=1547897 RepID=UPI000EF7F303|nr:PD-(D/E)XK nuclease family protein [Halostella salina]